MQVPWSCRSLLSTAAIAILPAMTGAQPVGSEFQVNTYTTKRQRPHAGHSIAADAGGNFVVVWQSRGQDGSGEGVFGQRFDASGQRLGAEFRINTDTLESQDFPSVAAAAGGEFVVVWTGDQRDGSYSGIMGQRYDGAGEPLGDAFGVNSYTPGRQNIPAVSSGAAGNFVVVWSSDDQDGSFYGIFAQRYDSGGAPLGGEFRVNTNLEHPMVSVRRIGRQRELRRRLGELQPGWALRGHLWPALQQRGPAPRSRVPGEHEQAAKRAVPRGRFRRRRQFRGGLVQFCAVWRQLRDLRTAL